MMELKYGKLTAAIEPFGSELRSLRREGIEYVWQRDPAWWPDSAPFLFPVVARQLNDSYILDGKRYQMPMHGFAKDRLFSIVESSQDRLILELTEDEETLGWYPFRFRVRSEFSLSEDGLTVTREVENPNAVPMPYSLGEHPGYRLPLVAGEDPWSYLLRFSAPEHAERWYLNDEIIVGSEPGLDGTELPLTAALFDRGALIFKHLCSDSVTLCSCTGNHGLTVSLKDYAYLGVWAKPGAPFVCIEPWNGLASSAWSSSELLQKEGIRLLPSGQTERFSMRINPF